MKSWDTMILHILFECSISLLRFKAYTIPFFLLHFLAFFHVASLLSTRVTTKKMGVDNEKAIELTNSTVFYRGRQWKSSRDGQQNVFFHISAWFQYRNITHKCNKTSCCIVAWSRQTFWSKLNFLLPKNESVLNILVYFLEQFQRFSRGLQPLENL